MIVNSTIESLTFVGAKVDMIQRLAQSCSNLSACAAFLLQEGSVLPETMKKWKHIDLDMMAPKLSPWSELRSLHFAGAVFAVKYVGLIVRSFIFFQDEKVSIETHPFSAIEFKAKFYNFSDFVEPELD